MQLTDYERPSTLRGVHHGPGTSCTVDIGWWVSFLKSMRLGWIKIVDDSGSMLEFAAACRAAGIVPIVRLYRQYPNPGVLRDKDWVALKEYLRRGITRWFETNNEPNLWDPEWHPDYRPQWKEGDPAVYDTVWFKYTAIPMIMQYWLAEAEKIIALGGYPAFPSMAQCGFHPVCGSIPFYRACFDYLKTYHLERTRKIWENGGWLSVHDATLNHFYHDGQKWHFEYPYDPSCQSRHPGKTIMDDDNSLIGHEAPRDMIWNRWQLRVPIISTEGGVFLDVGTQWDSNYPGISSAEYHGQATLAMFDWLDEYQKTHEWFFGMCPWIVAGQVLGHPTDWEKESWKKVDREEPVVRYLQSSPPRRIDVVTPEPSPSPIPIPTPSPTPEPPSPPTPEGFPRPPKDNGLGMHMGLELADEDMARLKTLKVKWATVAFGAGEDVILAAAKKLWVAGIMPVVRKVMSIGAGYAFGRDTQMLVAAGIPAYIQIFNEPSDSREWESDKKQKNSYTNSDNWCLWWIEGAKQVIAAGGYPGFQCLHPAELETLFRVLPPSDPIWKRTWFCSHNYGLNHPPNWKGDQWCVLGWQIFAKMFQDRLGFVPPIICGEGGWLYKASDDSNYPKVDDALHASYHGEMFRWFYTGKLSDGNPLPKYLYAVCPWILSGPSDEAWYGFTERTQTILAVQAIPEFVRGEGTVPTPQPQPTPQPSPQPKIEYKGLSQEMIDKLVISGPTEPNRPYWKITKVEIQPDCDKQSIYAILPVGALFTMQMFWADGQSEWVQPKADRYEPEGAKEWAASYPVFRGGWGSYGMRLSVNAESLRGVGLYEKQDGKIIISMTGHHPTLVYFQLVQPESPVVPPEPQPIPVVPYTLEVRLAMAPHGYEDLRTRVQALSDMTKVKAESLSAKRIDTNGNPLRDNLRQIVLHHLGGTYYGAINLAKESRKEGNAVAEYHFLIEKSGKLIWLVGVRWLTHHAYGANENGIGIVFEDDATEAQMETGRFLIAALKEWLGGNDWGLFREAGLLPHSMVWNKETWHTACPGAVWPKILLGKWPKLEAPK